MDSKTRLSNTSKIALVLAGIIALGIYPVSADVSVYPSVCRSSTGSGGQTDDQTFSSGFSTQLLLPALNIATCGAVGDLVIVTIFYAIPTNNPAIGSLSLIDNGSTIYTSVISQSLYSCRAVATSLGTCPAASLYTMFVETFAGTFTTRMGHWTLIASSSNGQRNFPYSGLFGFNWMFVKNLSDNTPRSSCASSIFFSSATNNNPVGIGSGGFSCATGVSPNSFVYLTSLYTRSTDDSNNWFAVGTVRSEVNQQTGTQYGLNYCTNNGGDANCWSTGGYVLNGPSQSTASYGLACAVKCAQTSQLSFVVAFGPACDPSAKNCGLGKGNPGPGPTPTNSGCDPACPGSTNCATTTCISNNGNDVNAGNYTGSNDLYYYVQQNTAGGGGTVNNFTTKIAQDHCKKATCYLFEAIYVPSTPTSPPSSANKLQLYSPVSIFPIANASTNVGVSAQMSVPIPANFYWAVAVVSNSTASGTTGASGTGVSIYAATWTTAMFIYQITGALMPSNFVGQIGTGYPLYFRAGIVTGEAATTSTTSSTTTLSVSTTFSTSTVSNVINAPNNNESGGGFIIPAMFIMVPFTLFALIGMTLKRFGDRR